MTVSLASAEVTDPMRFVNIARYLYPSIVLVMLGIVKVVVVAPTISVQLAPWSVDCCQRIVMGAAPWAVAVKDIFVSDARSVLFDGCDSITGDSPAGVSDGLSFGLET